MKCPLCNSVVRYDAERCPACGSDVTLGNEVTASTVTPTPRTPRQPSSDSPAKRNPISHSSLLRAGYEGQYVAGTTLADRYRIVALLGKGGMGEVYRAEDLRLNQTIA